MFHRKAHPGRRPYVGGDKFETFYPGFRAVAFYDPLRPGNGKIAKAIHHDIGMAIGNGVHNLAGILWALRRPMIFNTLLPE